ncbi:MAG: dihydropteroate synthase [Actinobacteria bacterium]|nr:dihydropteroate synthase [Actinomycetota bacterium]
MISLPELLALATEHNASLGLPVEPVRVGDRTFDVDARPAVMGTLNLSRDSTYRESIATSTESAIRKGRVMAAQGADFVDIGAESSTAKASRIGASDQIRVLVPVIEALAADGIVVSAETYEPAVVESCLRAGARILNLTGTSHDREIHALAAEFGATVVMCFVGGGNVRDVTNVTLDSDPIPGLLEHFSMRVDQARSDGVERIIIDPGMGFYYGNLVDPMIRVRHQTRVLMNSFRLRELGLPICNAVPHAFDLFEDQFRTAEGFFTVLSLLGGTSVVRTHEVPQVVAVVSAMGMLSAR